MYVLSYQGPNFTNVRAVVVESEDQMDRYIAGLPDGSVGLRVSMGVDSPSLKRLSAALMLKLHNAIAFPAVQKFDNSKAGREALFRAVKEAAVTPEPDELAGGDEPQAKPPAAPTQDPEPDAATVATSETATDPQEANMAKTTKAKSKSKKTAKPATKKSSNGLPREGSKAAKLLDLISRKEGATLAEMLKVTGWKECRGTASVLAGKIGKKLTLIKEEGKANRWKAE